MANNTDYRYGVRLAVIYAMVWFIDLLDASSLNVALPDIAQSFGINSINAEWAIVGFLLSMTISMSISGWLGDNYTTRKVFILAQAMYLISSIACGLAGNINALITFRILQGFAAGLGIPLGMAALLRAVPKEHWAKITSNMNMVTLVAPAVGPLFGAYAAHTFGWPSVFFLKIPLALLCLTLSIYWVRKEPIQQRAKFDWPGFILGGVSLSGILWTFSEIGKMSYEILIALSAATLLLGYLFIKREKKCLQPLIPLNIFKNRHFSYGNLIQSAANTIFLGANFVIALYLQKGLGHDIVTTGWIMAAITPGMLFAQPIVGKFYNKMGPFVFIIPGLILLSLSTYAFILTDVNTSPYILGALVGSIGIASSITQTANVTAIFSALPDNYKGTGSSLYSLFKQVSASFGVALSTMILAIGMDFHYCFFALGTIPAAALIFCFLLTKPQPTLHTT